MSVNAILENKLSQRFLNWYFLIWGVSTDCRCVFFYSGLNMFVMFWCTQRFYVFQLTWWLGLFHWKELSGYFFGLGD